MILMPKKLYPQHAVGQHLVSFPFVFDKNARVSHVLDVIEHITRSWPNTEYVYVIDGNKKLTGVIEFKKLLAARKTQALEYLMNTKFHAVTDHTHQENAAKLAVKEGLETIPVTDSNGHFLGIIDAGQIFKIMHEIHIEKLMHFSGILDNEALTGGYKTEYFKAVSARIPWLLFGLFGGMAATSIVSSFSQTLEEQIALAFFIPVIVYMNDAVGTQTQTVFVRYSTFEKVKLVKSILYETKLSLLIGAILALSIFGFASLWLQNNMVATVVGLSMFFGIVSSSIIGTIIPWILEKLGLDPAIGSGPFTTILQDLISIAIYFSIASALL
jgi:magnesium transporter